MGIRARWGVVLGALAAGCVTWGQPTLTVAPQALTFCVEVNNIPKGREAAALAIASNEKTSFTATASQPWIKLGAATGVTNFLDPVSVDLTGFSSNTYGGIVTVTVGSLITTVPVTALVTDTPTACLDNGPWEVWYERGSNVYPSPFVFHVYSTDGSAVPYSVQISPGSAGDFLSTFPQTGTTPGDVLFSLNTDVVSKIPDGTYPITVSLITAGAGKSPDVKVTLHVTDSPVIYTFPPVFTYPYQIGQPLTVQTLDASIDDGSAQTTAVQGLGCITGGPLTGTTPFEIRYGPTAPLPTQEGSCPSGLVLTSPAAANSPQISLGNVLTSTKPLLRSGVSHFRFQAPHGFNPPGQTFDVQSTDTKTPINFTLTTNLPGGETWLSIGSASGTTTQTIQVNVNADGLSPGSYFGGITALDTSPSGSKVPLTIPVSLLVATQATVSPNSLTFITNFKEAAPSPQTLTVTASGLGLEYILKASTTSGGNWLLLENGTGTTPGSITVSANPAGLGPGSYSGALSVAVGQAANSPLIVPVSLDDIGESGMTVNPASLTFTYSQGSNESPSTDLTVSSTGPAIDVNASAICHGCDNLIKVSPTSATTPATVTVSLNPQPTLGPGTYTGIVTLTTAGSASAGIPVTITVNSAPKPNIGAVVNSATQHAGPVSPGEIITIYGTGIGPTTPLGLQITSKGTVATQLGDTQVLFDGVPAPLIYVSGTQDNLIVPYEIAGKTATALTVGTSNGTAAITLKVSDTNPGIFTAKQTGSGQGAILNQDGSPNSASNPAAKGSVIQLFGTGEGVTTPLPPTGSFTPTAPPFAKPIGEVSVTFLVPGPGGATTSVPATIQFAGEAPGLVAGVLQVNTVIPAGVPSGTNTIVLTVGQNISPSSVTVAVR